MARQSVLACSLSWANFVGKGLQRCKGLVRDTQHSVKRFFDNSNKLNEQSPHQQNVKTVIHQSCQLLLKKKIITKKENCTGSPASQLSFVQHHHSLLICLLQTQYDQADHMLLDVVQLRQRPRWFSSGRFNFLLPIYPALFCNLSIDSSPKWDEAQSKR